MFLMSEGAAIASMAIVQRAERGQDTDLEVQETGSFDL